MDGNGMAQGIDPEKLMGYGWIPVVLNIVRRLFVTRDLDKYNLPKMTYLVWLALGTIAVGTLVFE